MPRARSIESIEAEKLYHSGNKLIDIAQVLGVPASTVRRWKSDQKWDSKENKSPKKQTERSEINADVKPSVRKQMDVKPSARKRKGAPEGNINASVTGAYMKIYGDLLTDKEKEIAEVIIEHGADRYSSLMQNLVNLKQRERNLIADIKDIRGGVEMITRKTTSQIEPTGQKAADGRELTKVVKISQEQETIRETIRRFEVALTQVQAEIRRTEDSLQRISENTTKDPSSEENGGIGIIIEIPNNNRDKWAVDDC